MPQPMELKLFYLINIQTILKGQKYILLRLHHQLKKIRTLKRKVWQELPLYKIILILIKLYQYIYDRSFTIVTDHNPLLGISSKNKSISVMLASRTQQCAIIMSVYDYNLTYKSGNIYKNIDSLSQFPSENKRNNIYFVFKAELVNSLVTCDM